ncbi:unnamed protein product [Pseudo-nitzschia multistriata]|uniref:Myosin motor domain-containing protein n=1 Tax=Pseudo-nitzschia multistriata TaxID=183589 RepID=A0A448ZR93_9STRA|nr:unnamed protein product [Pseudo-nitzschia multistriata]
MRRRRLSSHLSINNKSNKTNTSDGYSSDDAQAEATAAPPSTPSGILLNTSYVWVRTDVVRTILDNSGDLPHGWKQKPPSRKRGRNEGPRSWGWARARVVETPSVAAAATLPSSRSTHSRFGGNNANSRSRYQTQTDGSGTTRSVRITLAIEDDEYAPFGMNGKTVSLSYDSNTTEIVCNANSWWWNHETVGGFGGNDDDDCDSSVVEPPRDLTSLTHLHEPAVVYCLQKRYEQDSIYTYTGKILLALNPFRMLDNVYGEDIMELYWQRDELQQRGGSNPNDNAGPPPHAYAIAQDAYRSLLHEGDDQSILVSGESGSGKTVTTKIIMAYLASQSQRNALEQNGSDNGNSHYNDDDDDSNSDSREGIESQILQSNPILESFGNARTVRNDNSSRFGKFIELLFTPSTGQLVSASIQTYLLEKVRLISQAYGERNYHVFYELLEGATSPEERVELGLEGSHGHRLGPEDFRMTACSETFDRRDGVSDRDTFRDLREALGSVGGFSEEKQASLFSVVSALLHTSNITLAAGADESSQPIASESLDHALGLLGVSNEALTNALCSCKIRARGEVFHKKLSVVQATKALEALIKATYGALFDYIVATINESIASRLQAMNLSPRAKDLPRIGVLDIFGFESFEVNSYEQLCINYCNEALQQQFNKFVFKLEQREYEQEGIDWSFIEFPDNQDILDLIEKKRDGILSILDENCRLATCTDATFCQAIYEKCREHPRFGATQAEKADGSFSIEHYAGTVKYSAANFLEKNKDELPQETTELLTSSSVELLSYLGETLKKNTDNESAGPSTGSNNGFLSKQNKPPSTKRMNSSILRTTVGSQFSNQLRELRDKIDSTTPHYVRCLKPNDDLVPDRFEAHIIAEQLRCAGVLEAIRVSRVGFPHRYYHEQFIERYGMLTKKISRRKRGRDFCSALIDLLIPQVSAMYGKRVGAAKKVSLGMQVGFSKVFLRTSVFDNLEILRNKKLAQSVVVIQKYVRRFVACNCYFEYRVAAVIIQCFFRQVGASRETRRIKQTAAAIRIQSVWRTFMAETELMASRLIAHFGQTYWRGIVARKLCAVAHMEKQANVVQRCWRGHRARRPYRETLRKIILIQCLWRCKVARRAVRDLRREARSISHIAAERDRFREESVRLRREIENLRSSKSETGSDHFSSFEVEQLRREVQRLQTVISHSQMSVGSTATTHSATRNDYAGTSWPGSASGCEDFGGYRSPSLPKSICAHSHSPSTRRDSVVSASHSIGIGMGHVVSSPSTSLLDTDPEQEMEEYQLRNVSGSSAGPSGIFHASISRSILQDDEHRQGMAAEPEGTESKISSSSYGSVSKLHQSIRNNDVITMNRIIEVSDDPLVLVNAQNLDGRTALHVAVESSSVQAVTDLLRRSAVSNAQDFDGNTPLHFSTENVIATLLLDEGKANPNIPNIDGICALHNSVERLDVPSVRLLLKYGAKVNVADNINWFTPLHMALLQYAQGYSLDNNGSRAMIVDLLCGDMLQFDMNEKDREGNTPLHYSAQLETPDATEIMSVILEKGADPKVLNGRNQQALLLLCHNEDLRRSYEAFQECLHTLLSYGADPNHQSNSGCTPLHLCLYHQDIDSAIQLISHSAELHMMWNRPESWIPDGDPFGSPNVLALDMVSQETSVHRLLAAITGPPKCAPVRPWCMQCKSPQGSSERSFHCQHCGRHVCSNCTRRALQPDFFPKSFDICEASWVCIVCEDILVSRKEEFSNSTSTSATNPTSSLAVDDDELSSNRLHLM